MSWGQASTRSSGETLLVVDDDESVRTLISRLLEIGGHEAVLVGDAGSAVTALAEHPEVRLVLLDLNMPGGGVADTVARLRAVRRDVGILVITGHADPGGELEGVPVDGWLEKPFEPAELLERVKRALSESSG